MGEKSKSNKLKNEEVLLIRCQYPFASMQRIAKHFGVSMSTIFNIVNHNTWKHIDKDFFHVDSDEWRNEAWGIIKATPQHTYQILTKRPERILFNLPKDWGEGYPNVWFGISGEDQKNFDERMLHFKRVQAKVKFLSLEPLIGGIYLRPEQVVQGHTYTTMGSEQEPARGIDWVIIGGETGKYTYRECNIDWIGGLIMQCEQFEIPVFVKQLGTGLAKEFNLKSRHGGELEDIQRFFGTTDVRQMPKL